MGRQVYQKGSFKVYRVGHNYIVHNSKYVFDDSHTHVRTLNTAKKLIHCFHKKVIPKTFSDYLLISLTRVSDDVIYNNKINSLIDVRRQKGKKPKYIN